VSCGAGARLLCKPPGCPRVAGCSPAHVPHHHHHPLTQPPLIIPPLTPTPTGTPVGPILGLTDEHGEPEVDPASVLVLAVHDASGSGSSTHLDKGGSVANDLNGLVNGLVATALQAGFFHTLRSGVTVLNLFDAVANVDPLQFRMSGTQGRDVVAAAQALTEKWAVELCAAAAAAAAAAGAGGGVQDGGGGDDHAAATTTIVAAAAAAQAGGGDLHQHPAADSAAHRRAAAAAPVLAAEGPPLPTSPPPATASSNGSTTPGRNALLSSMGGGGGGGGAYTDAAGHELAYGCDCRPWWLASVDEAVMLSDEIVQRQMMSEGMGGSGVTQRG